MMELEKSRPAGISRKRFCELTGLNRSTLYYKPKGESAENLRIMEKIDRLYFDHPTAGVLTMVALLKLAGYPIGVKRIRRLMRKMNLMAIYPQKCLSKGGAPKYFHPYLFWMGRYCESEKQYEQAIHWYTLAAEQGDAYAPKFLQELQAKLQKSK